MNEVTKLYENAGIEPYKFDGVYYHHIEYPPFTAEKQLELIKWLCKNTYRNYLLIRYNFTNYYWQIECNMTDSNKLDNFAETIASIINNLWQDLTEEERKQIKEILE